MMNILCEKKLDVYDPIYKYLSELEKIKVRFDDFNQGGYGLLACVPKLTAVL